MGVCNPCGEPVLRPARSSKVLFVKNLQTQCSGHLVSDSWVSAILSRYSRRRWKSVAACSPTTTPLRPKLQQRGAQPRCPGKVRRSSATPREGAGDPSRPARQRPPRHRPELQQPGRQLRPPGEIRRGPAAPRKGAGDPSPPARRRPPRHGRGIQQPGAQPHVPGKVCSSSAALREGPCLCACPCPSACIFCLTLINSFLPSRRAAVRMPWWSATICPGFAAPRR